MKVINIDAQTTPKQLHVILADNSDCIFIHYRHLHMLKKGENLITEARRQKSSYDLLIALANNGFYLYMTKEDSISSFVHHSELPRLWKPIVNGEYIYNVDGLVYSLDLPKESPPSKLLVVFSSMNGPIYMSSLMRMFTQNYGSLSKHVSPDTAILRIADVGGVVGTYYMNSVYLKNNEDNIRKLIYSIRNLVGTDKVVLYGANKGGSAALLYSLYDDYDAVIVDPILSDDFYIKKYRDSHFTKNIISRTKQEIFSSCLKDKEWKNESNRIILTSINSPQFSYINDILLDEYGHHFSVFNNINPLIKDHPDVAPRSIHMVSSILNFSLNSIHINNDYKEFM